MRGIALTVATLGLVYATVALPTALSKTNQASATFAQTFSIQDQANPQQPQSKTYTGMISKSGDQFVLQDDAGKTSYQLDDQQTAAKYEGKKVKVTGTLDVANNLIRVTAIEEAAA
jgi:uncharacterized protein YdeI (BOF family)